MADDLRTDVRGGGARARCALNGGLSTVHASAKAARIGLLGSVAAGILITTGGWVTDKLDKAFMLQAEFMSMLVEHDKFPEYPVDLTTKPGQRFVKECIFNLVEELMEASFTLKNRQHKLSDDTELDFEHYREELGDAFAYFLEVCHLSGITAADLYNEYSRKNAIVRKRLQDGY